MIDRDVLAAERVGEEGLIAGDLPDPGDNGLVGLAGIFLDRHFDRVGQRALGLFFERGGPAVPELKRREGTVDHRWRASPAFLAADPGRERRRVGERLARLVTARARDRFVGREPRVEVEEPAKFGLFGAVRIVVRPEDRQEAEWHLGLLGRGP